MTYKELCAYAKKLNGKIVRGMKYAGYDDNEYPCIGIRCGDVMHSHYYKAPGEWVRLESER